jgi:hypothetical protein
MICPQKCSTFVCNPTIIENDENADPRDENTSIWGNDNIQTDVDDNQSHVGVGTSAKRGSALSEVNGNDGLGILRVYCVKVTFFLK